METIVSLTRKALKMRSIMSERSDSIATKMASPALGLLDLPEEMIFQILEFVKKKPDQGRLRLTSKKLYNMMKPIMYRKITFGSHEDYYERPSSRFKILVLYDTLSANPELASFVKRMELPDQGGKIAKKDVQVVTKRAVEYGMQDKQNVAKSWRKKVLRQYQKHWWNPRLTYSNGTPKNAVYQFYALAASLLLLKLPNLERLELNSHMQAGVPLFSQTPASFAHLLPLALPKLTRIDLPLRKFNEHADMVQYLEDNIETIDLWSYRWHVVRGP